MLAGCSKPIPDVSKLDGCYYGPGPRPLFEIRGSKLLAPAVTSDIALVASTSDSSEISFSPGIALSSDAHKSGIIVQGDEKGGLAYQRGRTRYILLDSGVSAIEVEGRECR